MQSEELKTKMEKCLKSLQSDLQKMRTGRASLSLLDDVKVSYYGSISPLNQVANLAVPEARLITISPWDPKMIGEIEKAILKSDLGISPTNDGKLIRLPIPALTEERRKELVKHAKKMGEESKIAIRHVRREAMDELKKKEKDSEISKDDAKVKSEEVEKITQSYVVKVDEILLRKEKELLEV